MPDPVVGEIRLFGFGFAPVGWARCEGQLLAIDQYQALFSILGTRFGGDGRVTFGLPDLRGRAPMHVGNRRKLGQAGGTESQPLSVGQMPSHSHPVAAGRSQDETDPSGAFPGKSRDDAYFTAAAPTFVTLAANTVGQSGGGKGHENRQPYVALNFSIALTGSIPPRN